MNDDAFQAKVLEHMGSTDAKLDNIEGWMGGISSDVKILNRDGCAKGAENQRRLGKVEDAPKKQAVTGVLTSSGVAAGFLAVAEVVRAFLTNVPPDINP